MQHTATGNTPPKTDTKLSLVERYQKVRAASETACEPLHIEDYVVQPRSEVSPPKWHLGHTTWFFEELILVQNCPGYTRWNDGYRELFNSYYKAAGKHWIQGERGNLSRPGVAEVFDYRHHIDEQMCAFLANEDIHQQIDFLLDAGVQHEQQHQELLYMDIKSIFAANPLAPVYCNQKCPSAIAAQTVWKHHAEGVYEVGFGGRGFSYDNEKPRHKQYVYPFALRENAVTNGEYLSFIEDKGYAKPSLWLSEGWDWLNNNGIQCPLYWLHKDNQWFEFSLYGLNPLDMNAPVCHISYFEADAFAHWCDSRLPTEAEFEIFLKDYPIPNPKETVFHCFDAATPVGQNWCWSRSHYSPYTGFQPFSGMLEEYNSKFMCNQFVLKGGCVATPLGHYRHSYRNFFQPQQRWMFAGIRLARDVS